MSFEFYICWKKRSSSLTKKKLMLNTIIIILVLHVKMWHGGKKKSNNCQNNLRSRPQSAFPIQCSKCIIDVKTSEEDQDGRPTNSKMLYVEVANPFLLLHTEEGRKNTGCFISKWGKVCRNDLFFKKKKLILKEQNESYLKYGVKNVLL